MEGYVIQRLENETRYYEIIGEEKGSPVIGESPSYTARYINPIEQVILNFKSKEE